MNSSFMFRSLLTAAVVACALPDGRCDDVIYRDSGQFRRIWDSVKCKWMYKCPTDHHTQEIASNADGATACDPAFITYDRAWASLKQMAVDIPKANVPQSLSGASMELERTLTAALDEVKTPDRAWAVAAEAWKCGVSVGFQRQALALVRSMTKTPSDGETLNFMFSALENPASEMERCRELGRGTAIERRKAADHLALLLQNPNLADRLK